MKLAILKGLQNKNNVTISCLPFVIGRCRTADFIIAHVNVSRDHCEIVKENKSWKVKDYSSSGTYVNGLLVGKGKSGILNDGDSIRFGPVESNLTWTFYSYDSFSENFNDSDVKLGLRMVLDIQNKNHSGIVNKHCFDEGRNKINEDIFDAKFARDKNEIMGKGNGDEKPHHCQTTNEGLNINNKYMHSLGKGYCTDNSKGKQIEELSKEVKQTQNDLIDLEGKNSALQEELVAGTLYKTEPLVASNLLENLADLMEAEFQCTICSELFVTAVTLSCTHTFCKHCINLWKKKQKTCPICRKKITNETRSLVVDNYIDKMVGNLSLELKKRREAIIEERNRIGPCQKKTRLKNKNL